MEVDTYNPVGQRLFVPGRQVFNIDDREDWCTGPRLECGNTPLEPDVGISHSAKQGFDEVVDPLARLVCQISKSGLEGRVNGDRGGRHCSNPPALCPSSHKRDSGASAMS